MEYTSLGATGLEVSRLCLGCANYGSGDVPDDDWEWTVDAEQGHAVIDRALEAGINFLDTANYYSGGNSEEIVGEAIDGRRDEVVLATKVGATMAERPNGDGLSRKHILEQAAKSLDRLGTDYVDLYYAHSWDDDTPIEETLSAFDQLVRDGQVRYAGASNLAGWQLMKALATSDRRNFERLACVQSEYSLVAREEETQSLPAAADQGVGVTTYSPLAAGFLAGRYERGETPDPGSRLAPLWDRWNVEARWETLGRVREVADETGHTPVQVSVAWVLDREAVDSVIVGPEDVDQLEEYLGALAVSLSAAQTDYLEAPMDRLRV